MIIDEAAPDLFSLTLNSDFEFSVFISGFLLITLFLLSLFVLAIRFFVNNRGRGRSYEIDEAEFGLGNQKITLKPNEVDRQIAYKIWVELSTRKVGLEIDLDHDVISEIYDSWYSFFSVTRELIKDVPVSKFRRKDTQKIINLSIDVLNSGIRPHLTKWQARFRRWYEYQVQQENNLLEHPQDIQKKFPDYDALERDLTQVNQNLIKYRNKMRDLISSL